METDHNTAKKKVWDLILVVEMDSIIFECGSKHIFIYIYIHVYFSDIMVTYLSQKPHHKIKNTHSQVEKPGSHHFVQSVEFTVAFLNTVQSAVHQHVNFEDLTERQKEVISSCGGYIWFGHHLAANRKETSVSIFFGWSVKMTVSIPEQTRCLLPSLCLIVP